MDLTPCSSELSAKVVQLQKRVETLESEREREVEIVSPSQLQPQAPFSKVFLDSLADGEAIAVLRVAWRIQRGPTILPDFLYSKIFSPLVRTFNENCIFFFYNITFRCSILFCRDPPLISFSKILSSRCGDLENICGGRLSSLFLKPILPSSGKSRCSYQIKSTFFMFDFAIVVHWTRGCSLRCAASQVLGADCCRH